LPVNHRVEFLEGSPHFEPKSFPLSPRSWARAGDPPAEEILPSSSGTWLIEPVKAPEFTLPDTAGNLRDLHSFQDRFLLLVFWITDSPECRDHLQLLNKSASGLSSGGIGVAAVNVDDPSELHPIQSFAAQEKLRFPILLATPDVAGIYNIVYRHMFDRHRDLPLPISFLIDDVGNIIKVYQGTLTPEHVLQDLASIPRSPKDRARKALPFPGALYQGTFQRNSLALGVALFQHGFLDQAAQTFKQVIAAKPDDPEAYYNLGTLSLRRNSLLEAQQYLEQTVKLRPNYPEAWNNLGMLAAQKGNPEEAIRNFQQSLQLRPSYATALLNLGNVYRRQRRFDDSERLLQRAVALEPNNPEVSYGLGMLYAQSDQTERAAEYLEKAISLRPEYSEALNNLGVLFVEIKRYADAEDRFRRCIKEAPEFDQAYLNLARLYLVLNNKEKARAVLQDLLQKQPQHPMAQQMLRMLY
jgi:Flp pilus assembly protein TadD/peroxiredoxin